jgi:hypothetical protein
MVTCVVWNKVAKTPPAFFFLHGSGGKYNIDISGRFPTGRRFLFHVYSLPYTTYHFLHIMNRLKGANSFMALPWVITFCLLLSSSKTYKMEELRRA